jgi:uncharacterized membrane protein
MRLEQDFPEIVQALDPVLDPQRRAGTAIESVLHATDFRPGLARRIVCSGIPIRPQTDAGLGPMIIDDFALARAIHVLALVHWIGGVAAVTTIVLPRARRLPEAIDAVAAFESFERPFASQARISILVAGLSGVYMLMKLDAWNRFLNASFWWLHLMVVVWILFALMIYVLEPLVLHRRFQDFAMKEKDFAFTVATRVHAVALSVAFLAIVAGVLGAHGGLP